MFRHQFDDTLFKSFRTVNYAKNQILTLRPKSQNEKDKANFVPKILDLGDKKNMEIELKKSDLNTSFSLEFSGSRMSQVSKFKISAEKFVKNFKPNPPGPRPEPRRDYRMVVYVFVVVVLVLVVLGVLYFKRGKEDEFSDYESMNEDGTISFMDSESVLRDSILHGDGTI